MKTAANVGKNWGEAGKKFRKKKESKAKKGEGQHVRMQMRMWKEENISLKAIWGALLGSQEVPSCPLIPSSFEMGKGLL